jgi:hypothetical protein
MDIYNYIKVMSTDFLYNKEAYRTGSRGNWLLCGINHWAKIMGDYKGSAVLMLEKIGHSDRLTSLFEMVEDRRYREQFLLCRIN